MMNIHPRMKGISSRFRNIDFFEFIWRNPYFEILLPSLMLP